MSNKPKQIRSLTKAQVLQGANYQESVYIDALDGEVEIRMLTGGEIAAIMAMPARGMKLSLSDLEDAMDDEGNIVPGTMPDASLEFDMEEMFLTDQRIRFTTVKHGLSLRDGEEWSMEEVESISPPAAINQIAREIWRISNVKESDLSALKMFRGE